MPMQGSRIRRYMESRLNSLAPPHWRSSAGPPPPTLPANIQTGLFARFVAGYGITKNGSDQISQWLDYSGNGNHATQSADANKPWSIADQAGRAVVRFGGAQNLDLAAGHSVASRNVSLFVAGRSHLGNSLTVISSSGIGAGLLRQTATPTHWSVNNVNGVLLPVQNAGVFGCTSGGSGSAFYTNLASQTGLAAVNNGTGTGYRIGSLGSGSYFLGEANEILIYEGAVTASTVMSYLAATYSYRTTAYPNQICFDGSSTTAGFGLDRDFAWPHVLASGDYRMPTWQIKNYAGSGALISSLTSRATEVDANISVSYNRNVLAVMIGGNDIPTLNPSGTYSALVTYVQARVAAGWEVWVCTLCVRTPDEATYNGLLRGTSGNGIIVDAGATAVVDFGALPQFDGVGDDSGSYHDGTHPTGASQILLANEFQRVFS